MLRTAFILDGLGGGLVVLWLLYGLCGFVFLLLDLSPMEHAVQESTILFGGLLLSNLAELRKHRLQINRIYGHRAGLS